MYCVVISRRDIYNLNWTGIYVFPCHLGDNPVNQSVVVTTIHIFNDGQPVTTLPINQLIYPWYPLITLIVVCVLRRLQFEFRFCAIRLTSWLPGLTSDPWYWFCTSATSSYITFQHLVLTTVNTHIKILCSNYNLSTYHSPLNYLKYPQASSTGDSTEHSFILMLPCVVTDFFLITNQTH
jgi:hypothetical protein